MAPCFNQEDLPYRAMSVPAAGTPGFVIAKSIPQWQPSAIMDGSGSQRAPSSAVGVSSSPLSRLQLKAQTDEHSTEVIGKISQQGADRGICVHTYANGCPQNQRLPPSQARCRGVTCIEG